MDVCRILPLQHLACTRVVTLLLNKKLSGIAVSCLTPNLPKNYYLDLREFRDEEFKVIETEILRDIIKLNVSTSLQKKLEIFIGPLFTEIEEWIDACFLIWAKKDNTFSVIMDNIPQCWLQDGTLDREKSAMFVVKNDKLLPVNRFIFACFYCLYEEILNLWKQLSRNEKMYLRERTLLKNEKDFVVKQWIDWLESRLNKDWPFCVAWILGTCLWNINVCVMKRVLLALSPKERKHYVFKVLKNQEVNSDVMRFCLSVMTREEQELICKDSPIEVIKCVTSWPLQSCFSAIADMLWPHITVDNFCDIIMMILLKIRNQRWDYVELLVILINFWSKSPEDFQETARQRLHRFALPLEVVLDFETTEMFSKEEFLEGFCSNSDSS